MRTAVSPGSRSTAISVSVYQRTRPQRSTLHVARFMRSDQEDVGPKDANLNSSILDKISSSSGSLDELQGAMTTATQRAKDSLGWLRHALQDPDDFSASAIGRMVSKEYGRHERPHTEHHLWHSAPTTSPVASPKASAAASSPTPNPQQQQQQVQGHSWGWGSFKGTGNDEVYHSPPSGPGFLLQQQQQQK